MRTPLPPNPRIDFKMRLSTTRNTGRNRCWVLTCNEPSGNASGAGVGRFCRKHLEHYRRHGDPLKESYRAARTRSLKSAALYWVKSNRGEPFVQAATSRIESLMQRSGPVIAPRNLPGLSAQRKACATWARMRSRRVEAGNIVAAVLSIVLCHALDPQKGKVEYRRVQIAKVLNRIAGGEVKRWPTHHSDPALPREKVLKWFPASEGLVLRVLGKSAEEALECLIPGKIDEILEFVARRSP